MALVTFVLLDLPIAVLAAFAFNAGDSLADRRGFSVSWFATVWSNDAVQEAALRSLVIAVVAATMAAVATTRTAPYRGLTFKYAFSTSR